MARATHIGGNLVQGVDSIEAIVSADTVTKDDSGKIFYLNAAEGATITLPAVRAGLRLEFVVASLFATSDWVIASAEGDNIDGSVEVAGAVVIAGAEDQVNFVATADSLGDRIYLTSDGVQWFLSGSAALAGGITVTDPA